MDSSKDPDSQQVITSSDPAVDMKDSDSQTATLSPSRHNGSPPASQTYLQKLATKGRQLGKALRDALFSIAAYLELGELATKGRRLGKAVLDAAFSIATYLKPGECVQNLLRFMLHVLVAKMFITDLEHRGGGILYKDSFHRIADINIEDWVHVCCVGLNSVLIVFAVGRVMWMAAKI